MKIPNFNYRTNNDSLPFIGLAETYIKPLFNDINSLFYDIQFSNPPFEEITITPATEGAPVSYEEVTNKLSKLHQYYVLQNSITNKNDTYVSGSVAIRYKMGDDGVFFVSGAPASYYVPYSPARGVLGFKLEYDTDAIYAESGRPVSFFAFPPRFQYNKEVEKTDSIAKLVPILCNEITTSGDVHIQTTLYVENKETTLSYDRFVSYSWSPQSQIVHNISQKIDKSETESFQVYRIEDVFLDKKNTLSGDQTTYTVAYANAIPFDFTEVFY